MFWFGYWFGFCYDLNFGFVFVLVCYGFFFCFFLVLSWFWFGLSFSVVLVLILVWFWFWIWFGFSFGYNFVFGYVVFWFWFGFGLVLIGFGIVFSYVLKVLVGVVEDTWGSWQEIWFLIMMEIGQQYPKLFLWLIYGGHWRFLIGVLVPDHGGDGSTISQMTYIPNLSFLYWI